MTIVRNSIRSLLLPGLHAVTGDYANYPLEWPEIYKKQTSKMAFERDTEMKYTGMAQIQAENAPTAMDDMGQRFTYVYFHRKLSLGFSISEEAQEDNLYQSKFPMMTSSLRRSMNIAEDTLGAAPLLNGFNAAFPGGDGVSLFNTAHPTDVGTYANTFTVQADLNETSLESAIIGIQQFKDLAGNLCKTNPKKLIVGPALQFTASRLLNSEYRVTTPNNDISAIVHGNYVPQGYKVNHYLTSMPGLWILLTDAEGAFNMFERTPLKSDVYTDFSTGSLLAKMWKRLSFGWSNPRGGWASSGA